MGVPARREEQETKSLSDIFNQFAKESVAQFPAAKGRLLIYEHNEQAAYGRESLDLEKAGYSDKAIDALLKKRAEPLSRETYAQSGPEVLNLYFILYDLPVKENERQAVPENTEKDIHYILDHELAHLVIRDPAMEGENAHYKAAVSEAIADAYAVIRHIQRYGADSDHKNPIIDSWSRASN